ncbi:hypothetical protein BKA93DRAFT_402246 [Sparassis latifolia]
MSCRSCFLVYQTEYWFLSRCTTCFHFCALPRFFWSLFLLLELVLCILPLAFALSSPLFDSLIRCSSLRPVSLSLTPSLPHIPSFSFFCGRFAVALRLAQLTCSPTSDSSPLMRASSFVHSVVHPAGILVVYWPIGLCRIRDLPPL